MLSLPTFVITTIFCYYYQRLLLLPLLLLLPTFVITPKFCYYYQLLLLLPTFVFTTALVITTKFCYYYQLLLSLLYKQMKSYLAGNPELKLALNEELVIGKPGVPGGPAKSLYSGHVFIYSCTEHILGA